MKKCTSLFAVTVLLAALYHPASTLANPVSGAGLSAGNPGTNYFFIIDYTQGNNLNAVLSNTQLDTNQNKNQIPPSNWVPLTGFEYPPTAIINPSMWPTGGSATAMLNPDLYVQLYGGSTGWSDLSNQNLGAATEYTCYQNLPGWCPPGSTLPQSFVYRTGSYLGGTGITMLTNSALQSGSEAPASYFDLNDQAFNMDRIRYAANRLWFRWYEDVADAKASTPTPRTASWYDLSKKYNDIATGVEQPYQMTGTMSFENFLDNVVNNRPMYGLVRVVIPVDTNSADSTYGMVLADPNQPIRGAEFTANPTYTWKVTNPSLISATSLTSMVQQWGSKVYHNSSVSGEIIVYGSLLMDYVAASTYNPNDFIDDSQDYVDNYSSVQTHDSTISSALQGTTTIENAILPRATSTVENIKDDESIAINPTYDFSDNRVDTLDYMRAYMKSSTPPSGYGAPGSSTGISDAAIYEYWMRQYALSVSAANLTKINTLNSEYNLSTQLFNSSSSTDRQDYINNVWPSLTGPNRAHAFFPSGYEHGWMVAFDALRMDALDATTTAATPGSWWSSLTDTTKTGTVTLQYGSSSPSPTTFSGRTVTYVPFGVPANANEDISVDANGDGHSTLMPNFFTTDWEDLPAFYYAGGYLNIAGNANIGGMVYTPDPVYIDQGAGTTSPSSGAQEYINGAVLAGDGIWIGGNTSANLLIAVSYNYNAFDRLRHAPVLQTNVEDITELRGQ